MQMLEKKNFGVPATLLSIITYVMGYSLSQFNYSTLIIAIPFAIMVFAFPFEDKVRNAVKQAYLLAFFAMILYLALEAYYNVISIMSPAENTSYSIFNIYNILYNFYKYATNIFKIASTVIFLVFILSSILKKELKFEFLLKIYEEALPKQAPYSVRQPVYQPGNQQGGFPVQQPNQPMYQQPGQSIHGVKPVQSVPTGPQMNSGQGQSYAGQQVQSAQPQQSTYLNQPLQSAPQNNQSQGIPCPSCHTVNGPGAAFCSKCGTKLN
ncbi:MAG: hypothetical protein K0S47_1334 [Herbinix sp.]|jgi:hypothetical protein|nr:hypothetical protein [Herbinix sp.]